MGGRLWLLFGSIMIVAADFVAGYIFRIQAVPSPSVLVEHCTQLALIAGDTDLGGRQCLNRQRCRRIALLMLPPVHFLHQDFSPVDLEGLMQYSDAGSR